MSVPEAIQLVEVACKATTAYGRPDLTARLRRTRERLADPNVRVLVVGEFKQGKSQLVNSLISAPVCPVDDDIATAVVTVVRHAEVPSVTLVREPAGGDGEPGGAERVEVPLSELAAHVSEAGNPDNRAGLTYAEVGIPRALLAGGLVLVDTPGVGGLGSAHGASTMAALGGADAVLLVSDAAQEYTRPELDFLAAAMRLCPNVAAVLTKTDLYPRWRRIAELDRAHLATAGISAELIPVSSTVRQAALRTKNTVLNEESGYPVLVRYLREQVLGQADLLDRRSTAQDILEVCEQLATTMRAELSTHQDPGKAQEVVAELERSQAAAARLKDRSARWQITLNDGVADLVADVEHDLRERLRRITTEGETLVDAADPAAVWDQFAAWVHEQVCAAAAANFVQASERARALAARVAAHFAEDGEIVLPDLRAVPHTEAEVSRVTPMTRPELAAPGGGEQALSGLRGGYMGGLMLFMPLSLIPGLAVAAPFAAVGGALLLGRKQVRDDRKRALQRRRSDAKIAMRKHVDEVQFQVGKDCRAMLRTTQRTLRDHFTEIAEQMHTSMTASVAAAQKAVRSTEAERATRIGDLEAELARVEHLAARARAMAGTR
ncbi:MAG TPA: dynamin family protein [Pseudonocardia sp.]|nr:dynamin family protein [Pseudonocardia sp.]